MSLNYEELDFRQTPLGDLMLRRRRMLQLGGRDVWEVKLGEHFLMSSLFHEAESQLAKLGLRVLETEDIDVVVGGSGWGTRLPPYWKTGASRRLLLWNI